MKELIKKKSYKILAKQFIATSRNFKTIFSFNIFDPHLREALRGVGSVEISTDVVLERESSLFITDTPQSLKFLKDKIDRSSRIVTYQPRPLFNFLIKKSVPESSIDDICQEYGFAVIEERRSLLFRFFILRPKLKSEPANHFLSIIVPCRNEKGNIEKLLMEMPKLEVPFEIIFIEGHSLDNTWEEILSAKEIYGKKFLIKCHQQKGSGKANAVEEGIAISNGCLITILDADLTVHPKELVKFIDLFMSGEADFVNGCRLSLPMEKGAMRSLNKFGNWFFAQFLSFVLRVKITDSLCGTKLFTKKDYDRFMLWREEFGNHDPFGDFNLLFPASIFKLGIKNLPVQYRARVYGTTNISRFYHGWLLLKMGIIGLFKIRLKIFGHIVVFIPENLQNYL